MTFAATDTRPAFRNEAPRKQPGFLKALKIFWDFTFNKPADTVPGQALPVQVFTQEQLLAAPDNTLYRLGHATILMKLNGELWWRHSMLIPYGDSVANGLRVLVGAGS